MAEPHAQLFMAYTHGAPGALPRSSRAVSWVSWTHHFTSSPHAFQQERCLPIDGYHLNSTAVSGMLVNPWRGTASVQFKNGKLLQLREREPPRLCTVHARPCTQPGQVR